MINCPKEFEPDVLNTSLCVESLKTQNVYKLALCNPEIMQLLKANFSSNITPIAELNWGLTTFIFRTPIDSRDACKLPDRTTLRFLFSFK